MHSRVFALLLALFVAGAPAAIDMCHLSCASHERTGSPRVGNEAASCHRISTEASPRAGAASDECSRTVLQIAAATTSDRTIRTSLPQAATVDRTLDTTALRALEVCSARSLRIQHDTGTVLSTQLRI